MTKLFGVKMQKLLIVALLIFPSFTSAIPSKEKFMIKTELQVGDQTIFPRVLVLNGETATVDIDSLRFELQPLLIKANDIQIKAKVFRLTNGEAELISSPIVKARLGEKISISAASLDGSQTQLSLKMIAHKQK